ncbi:cytochrome P450 [Streptomyces sp. NPDC028635]|uniref:cytochrome P450 n=1 Tax=Streptomyces sp. NPDC028635 TaxID=3154800 RepID=UPI0033BFDA16
MTLDETRSTPVRAPHDLIELLREAAGAGPVAAVQVGGRPCVLVTGPEQTQQVLARRPDVYVKRGHRARLLLGDGLISATGEAWKQQRRLLQAQFTLAGTRRWAQHITAAAERVADGWEAAVAAATPVDVGQDMRLFALDTIWRSLTGTALDDVTRRELDAVDTVVASLPTTAGGAPEPSPAVDAALRQIDTTAHRAIAAARADRARDTSGPSLTLLGLLLDASGTDPRYTDALIRDELVTLLVAGHETTAQTLCWLFVLLDQHPDVHERFLTAYAGTPDPARRDALICALVQETLRLYPAVWLVPRQAARDDVLDGHPVPAGTSVLVCPYLTHRSPVLWPDPERFDPSRFLPGGERPGHPAAYLPFGSGARACLGQHFALQEMVTLLRLLLPVHRPHLAPAPRTAVFGANLRPQGSLRATLGRVRYAG